MLKEVLKFFDSRIARQELAKRNIPIKNGVKAFKTVLTAMFFSIDVSYVIKELNCREELRRFLNVDEIIDKSYIYRFLSRFTSETFVNVLSLLNLNLQCTERRKKRVFPSS